MNRSKKYQNKIYQAFYPKGGVDYKLIEGLLDIFKIRASKILDDTNDIGWGLNDYLVQVHGKFYSYDSYED